ncbi:MAG: SxtJ family membrane protein [Planctomycetota bacterium]|jgi:hypothetical protein
MALIKINWNPGHKELRSFGKIALIASALVSILLYLLKGLGVKWALIILGVGFVIFLSSLVCLKLTRMIYVGLTAATLPIGFVVSFILLAAFYFLLLTPLALFFRLIGRDPLHREFDSAANSYWGTRHPPRGLDRYFQQF